MKNSVQYEDIKKIMDESTIVDWKLGDKTTAVMLTTKEGFVITETSSCVSAENYNHEIGKELCLNKIEDKLWAYEGYLLQKKMYQEAHKNDE